MLSFLIRTTTKNALFVCVCPLTIKWPRVFSGLQPQVPIQLCCRVHLRDPKPVAPNLVVKYVGLRAGHSRM